MTQFAHKQLPVPEHDGGPDPMEMALKEASGGSNSAGGGQKQSALAKVHQIFRGRYHWVVILGVALGSVGGYLGFNRGHKTYMSSGTIQVKMYIPKITGTGDETGFMQAYDAFVQQQISALLSRNVIGDAVKNPQWAGLVKIEDQNLAELDLQRRMKVTQKGELLIVEASDENPALATAAVNSVMSTYRRMYVDVKPEDTDPVIIGLKSVKSGYEKELLKNKTALDAKIKEAGSDQLDADYASKQQQASKVEETIQKLIVDIAVAQGEVGRDPLLGKSDEELKLLDPTLIALTTNLNMAEMNVERAKSGISTSPQALENAKKDLRVISDQIDNRLGMIKEYAKAGVPLPWLPKLRNEDDVKAMQAGIDRLKPIDEKLRSELIAIGKLNIELRDLKAQVEGP